jgi:hypothetical protein
MTMTTFDGKPYIEPYTLSKLEIVADFGTEKKSAPTPVDSQILHIPPCRIMQGFSAFVDAFATASCFAAVPATDTLVGPPRFLERFQALKRRLWYSTIN